METLVTARSMKNVFTKETDGHASNAIRTAQRIAFVHHKGGTGKTTACINIAGWLVKLGQQVLMVDLDPQGNATAGLGVDRKTTDGSLHDALFGAKPLEEVILETSSGVHLAPSSVDLLGAEMHLGGQANSAGILREQLGRIENHFDYILIDVPPGSTQLMINGLVASEEIIIPLDVGVFAYEALETLKTLVLSVAEELRVETRVKMVLLRECSYSIFDKGPTRDIRNLIRGFLESHRMPGVKVWTIPFSRKIGQAQMRGLPISHVAPYSDVGRIFQGIARDLVSTRKQTEQEA